MLVLDTHALAWWSARPELLSREASAAVDRADELLVAGVTWFELAWLVARGRVRPAISVGSWFEQLEGAVRTIGLTPAVALTAVGLPDSFPGDPADRQIYATALEHGARLVTKDRRLRAHRASRPVTIW